MNVFEKDPIFSRDLERVVNTNPEEKKLIAESEHTLDIASIQDGENKRIQELREQIGSVSDNIKEKPNSEDKEEKRKTKYIDKYFPEYLSKSGETSVVYKVFRKLAKLFSVKEVLGKESLPEGVKLFIANHRGGETGKLIAALDDPVHIVSAETINWNNDKIGAFRWIMKKLGMISIRETFSHLDEEQKRRAVAKSRLSERAAHAKVAEGVKKLGGGNIENIKAMVALLLSGEDVAIFTEGPFSRLDEDERRSYAGYALVAREYKRITGEDLNIVPTGIRGSKIVFGDIMQVDQSGRQSKEELEDLATEKIHALYASLK